MVKLTCVCGAEWPVKVCIFKNHEELQRWEDEMMWFKHRVRELNDMTDGDVQNAGWLHWLETYEVFVKDWLEEHVPPDIKATRDGAVAALKNDD